MRQIRLLSTVILYSVLIFVAVMLMHIKNISHFNFRDFIVTTLLSIIFSLFIVGIEEMDRGGHEMYFYKRIIGGVILCLFIFYLVFWGGLSENWMLVFFLPFAVPLPLALYLNRKHKKSKQLTIDNAS
ncbi:MAG: hypothetical protein WAN35_06990 [Terracidiphilus sp.]